MDQKTREVNFKTRLITRKSDVYPQKCRCLPWLFVDLLKQNIDGFHHNLPFVRTVKNSLKFMMPDKSPSSQRLCHILQHLWNFKSFSICVWTVYAFLHHFAFYHMQNCTEFANCQVHIAYWHFSQVWSYENKIVVSILCCR